MQLASHCFQVDNLSVEIHYSKPALGAAAANRAASFIQDAISRLRRARIIVGTGPSQNEVIDSLVHTAGIDWQAVEVFHMDEYTGMPMSHPASFGLWLKTHLAGLVHPGKVHYLDGTAPDPEAECRRYAELLAAGPVDVCFAGFGENGHIAFNDPGVADFDDPVLVKRVVLDERCRMQQVGEGHFADLDSAPREAMTLTCPALLASRHIICSVPDRRKAEAVRDAVEGPISIACPASAVRRHPGAFLFLEPNSAALLSQARQIRG
jgi:glucosamine-6-phosphate deaminase